MASLSHIIIPQVAGRHPPLSLNLFALAPPPPTLSAPSIPWKKSLSAFRKFKQKRDRREKRLIGSLETSQLSPQTGLSRPVRLKKRQPQEEGGRGINEETEASLSSYYDPNLAPLYEFDLTQPSAPPLAGLTTPTKPLRIEQERNSSGSQPEDCREQLPRRLQIEVRSDDPFIIIRKEGKKQRQTKAKTIKKDKPKTECKHERRDQSLECGLGNVYRQVHPRSEQFDSEDSPVYSVPARREISTLQELARMAQSHPPSEE